MSHDIEQAKRFLTLLDEGADQFTFQTFDDKPGKNPALAKWMHGDIDALFNELVNYNKLGAGVFVMVQGGDGSGRNIKSVNKIRCVFNENDHGVPKKQPLEPQIIVESSPGKAHYYFLTEGLALNDFKPIQGRLIADYGSDPAAHDLPRVMRLPGFYHNKSEPHLVTIVHESGGQAYSREQIIEAFPPYIKPVIQSPEAVFSSDKLSLELRSALGVLRSADYAVWIKVGLALSSLGDIGRGLWLEWSQQDEGFDFSSACKKWETFKPDSIGYKSVFALAQDAGWVNVARRSPGGVQDIVVVVDDSDGEWINADDMADTATAPIYLINNIIEARTHGLIAGSSQSFKSFCVLKMAHSICTGRDFFNHDIFDTGKVLYICGEGIGALGRRIKALKIVEGGFNNNFYALNKPLFIDNIAEMVWLNESINRINPVMVFFDTFSSLATSTKENANEEVARTLKMVADCCAGTGASSLVVHHYGKDADKGSRGASAFSANVDFEIGMARKEGLNAIMSCKKSKDGDFFEDIEILACVVELGLTMQDGRSATSLVLKKAGGEGSLSPRQETALDAIKDLIAEHGIFLNGVTGVTEKQIKDCFNIVFESEGRSRYGIFGKIIPVLIKKRALNKNGDLFWV